MSMPGRNFSTGSQYRYGFNGQEKTDEISGIGNHNTAEHWEYDTRLGRRWNLDPVYKHSLSNYLVLGNNPILYQDPLGDDWFVNGQGFYIWSNSPSVFGFEYSGTDLPNGVSRYRILTSQNGELYHKYVSSPWIKKFNAAFDTKLNPLKRYDAAEESFNEDLIGTAIGYGVFKVGGIAYNTLKSAGGSLWKIANPLARGFVYEVAAGGNLVKNYPVIDKFIKGVATSIKTLDLKAKTYQTASNVYGKLKGYIDDLYEFQGAVKGGVNTTNGAIKEKVLDVAIPKGATAKQIEMIQKAIDYGASKGIKVKVNTVK